MNFSLIVLTYFLKLIVFLEILLINITSDFDKVFIFNTFFIIRESSKLRSFHYVLFAFVQFIHAPDLGYDPSVNGCANIANKRKILFVFQFELPTDKLEEVLFGSVQILDNSRFPKQQPEMR